MSTHSTVLALYEEKAEAGRERGQTRRMWVHEILWARKHLAEYHKFGGWRKPGSRIVTVATVWYLSRPSSTVIGQLSKK